jgi:hypothetical protein
MRLTLRTLLAWLDDTLPAAEVRQIGQQVAESPFAQELVERIHRVTRRRRLTVPTDVGADGTDPALVASYLDNELSPEQVAEFEKRCLTSDVHLAEVASVHQILSLIGQKAKVPEDARLRMYRLVKGREALGTNGARAAAPPKREPAAAPLPPWTPPEPAKRPVWERYGPMAAVCGFLLLLVWSAWSLVPRSKKANDSTLVLTKNEVPPAEKRAAQPAAAPVSDIAGPQAAPSTTAPAEPTHPQAEPAPDEKGAEAIASNQPAGKPAVKKKAANRGGTELPAGAVASVGKGDGIVLRWNETNRGWERLAPGAGLRADDRVVGLPPFRNQIVLDGALIELFGDAEIHLRAPKDREVGRFDLLNGRVVVRAEAPTTPLGVGFGGKLVSLKLPAGEPVGLERVNRRAPGDEAPAPASLRIYASEGDVRVDVGRLSESLAGPVAIDFQPPDRLSDRLQVPPMQWDWVTETQPNAMNQEIGKQFGQYFSKPEDSPMTSIMLALEDEQEPVRQLAIAALGATDSIDEVVAALSNPDAAVRRAGIGVLRLYHARGVEADQQVRKALARFGGDDWAAAVDKLLKGFTTKEEKEEATYAHLVALLKHKEVAVRELALADLQFLTRRDALGYDPDKPDGPGLKAWQDLLKKGELTPKAKND